jgi:hypothetical protein
MEEKQYRIVSPHYLPPAPQVDDYKEPHFIPPAQLDDYKDFDSSDSEDEDLRGALQSNENLLLETRKPPFGLSVDIEENADDESSIQFSSPLPAIRRIASPPAVSPSPVARVSVEPAPAAGGFDYYKVLESVFKELHTARSQVDVVSKERDLLIEQAKALNARIAILEKNLEENSSSMSQLIRAAIQEQIGALIASVQQPRVDLSTFESQVESLRTDVGAGMSDVKHRLDFLDSKFESLIQLSSMVHSKMADLEMMMVHQASADHQHHHHERQNYQQQQQHQQPIVHFAPADDDWELVSTYSSSPSRQGDCKEYGATHTKRTRGKKRLGEGFFGSVTPAKDLLESVLDTEKSHAQLLNELEELGFRSRELNAMLLKLHNYDFEMVKKELCALELHT